MFDNFNKNIDIISALNTLNIKHQNKPNSKGWIDIICPLHNDHSFGNASININSGVISCFKCGQSKNISSLLKERNSNYIYTPQILIQPKIKKQIQNSSINKDLIYNFIHKEIDKPEDFYYLKQRGFTKEFCKEFKIVRSFTDPYCDYFAFPIIDSNKSICLTEFRKLMQIEYLQTYYNSCSLSYEQLNEDFKQHCKDNNIHITNYKLYKGNEIIIDKVLFYLLDKKVKYESGSRIKETIFNIDNLNYNEILWLVEGIGSIPKIWNNISKNVTCTFGSQISLDQIIYLKKFKQINLVVDQDEAGVKMVIKLRGELKNFFIIDILYEDTDEEYVNAIKNCKLKLQEEFLAKSILKYGKTLF